MREDVQTRRRPVQPRSERALERGTHAAPPRRADTPPGTPRARTQTALVRWAVLVLAAVLVLLAGTRLHARLRAAHVLRTSLERALRAPDAPAPDDPADTALYHDKVALAAVLGEPGTPAAAAAERARAEAVRAAARDERWLTAPAYSRAALQRVRVAVLGPRTAATPIATSYLWLFDRAHYVVYETDSDNNDENKNKGKKGKGKNKGKNNKNNEEDEVLVPGAVVRPVQRHEEHTYTRHMPARDTHALVAFLRSACTDSGDGGDGRWLLLSSHTFVLAPHLVRLVHALDGAGLAADALVLGNTAPSNATAALGSTFHGTPIRGYRAPLHTAKDMGTGTGTVEDPLRTLEDAGEGVLSLARGALLSPAAVAGVCGAVARAGSDALLRLVEPRDDAGLVLTLLARTGRAAVVHAPALFPAHGPRDHAAFAEASDTAVAVPALSTDAVFNAGVLAHEYFRVHEQAPTCNMPEA